MALVDEIKSTILDSVTLFGFEYNGKDGSIDPIEDYFYIRYGADEQKVNDFDAVLNTPFVNGHTLQELSDSGANVIITEQ